jgi:hypothetical protein
VRVDPVVCLARQNLLHGNLEIPSCVVPFGAGGDFICLGEYPRFHRAVLLARGSPPLTPFGILLTAMCVTPFYRQARASCFPRGGRTWSGFASQSAPTARNARCLSILGVGSVEWRREWEINHSLVKPQISARLSSRADVECTI